MLQIQLRYCRPEPAMSVPFARLPHHPLQKVMLFNVADAICMNAGRRQIKIPYSCSSKVMEAFEGIMSLLRTFAQRGWFLHLAFMENVKGRFDALHNDVVIALSEVGISDLPSGKHLLPGDYRDPTRSLRRCDPFRMPKHDIQPWLPSFACVAIACAQVV
jgi:hypothetical protein